MSPTNHRKDNHVNRITLAPRTSARLQDAAVALSSKEVDILITSLETRLNRGERIFKASGVVDPDWSKCAIEVYALLDRLETVRGVGATS